VILGALVCVGLLSHDVFTQGSTSQTEAIQGATIIVLGIAIIVMLAKLSTHGRLRGVQPSFSLTTLSVVGITLIFGLAGVEPMAHYLRQFGATLDPWIGWARLGLGIGFLVALISPFYVLVAIAIIVWIIYTIRHW